MPAGTPLWHHLLGLALAAILGGLGWLIWTYGPGYLTVRFLRDLWPLIVFVALVGVASFGEKLWLWIAARLPGGRH